MASGTPVISTDVGPGPELIVDGVTGFIIPQNDSRALGERLLMLLNDQSRARQMGQAAYERVVREFTWRRTAERCLDAYKRTVVHG
jgi:glycosyltransferase involved in cell wall biosynthesis